MRERMHALGPVALALGLLLVLGGCGRGPAPSTGPKPVAPTPISRLNTEALQLARVDFCDLVPANAIRDALGGSGTGRQKSWRNGDPAQVDKGVVDVVHEYGCSWARAGQTASAWLFARSVTPKYARAVIDKTSRRKGCTTSSGPQFGTPSQRQVCTLPDGSHRVRLSGLFRDVWLTCQVSGPAGAPERTLGTRADAWCVQVANVTNTSR
ncbi:MAG: hypothetical protein M3Y66_00470 [Actinomycetota bacterium]|nr:hypothetical protein [Actinomycetota bacterium]